MSAIYEIIGGLEILIFLVGIARYIFLVEGPGSPKQKTLFWGAFLLAEGIVVISYRSGEGSAALPFLFLLGYLWRGRNARRIRGLFLAVPITGMMLSVIVIPFAVVYLFVGSMKWVLGINTMRWFPMM